MTAERSNYVSKLFTTSLSTAERSHFVVK